MSSRKSAFRSGVLRSSLLMSGLLVLAACSDGTMPGFLQKKPGGEDTVARAATGGSTTVERDVEAPEVFQVSEAGLWDGRPSLGGVWVAHPDVDEPERVIIRNEKNGKFVIGALFRRERQTPGPRLQVSSDAAAAIGMLAGQPTNLNVVALRREEVEEKSDAVETATADPVPEAPTVSEGTLDPVVSGAAMAIETAALDPAAPQARPGEASSARPEPRPDTRQTAAVAPKPPAAAPSAAPKPAAAPTPKKPSLSRPFVQIGIFSVEQNARNTATAMRQAGMVPTVKKHSLNDKIFWRVVVGPARDKAELDMLIEKIRDTGFTDAYAVSD